MDFVFTCGNKAYAQLPKDWKGRCALSQLIQPTMVVPEKDLWFTKTHPLTATARLTRGGKARAARYFEDISDIPDEFKLFSEAQIILGSISALFIPAQQIRANALWLQRTCYEMMLLVNYTSDGLNAVRQELRALHLISLQNRYILDFLTASTGGVCKIIGHSCCTFVPDQSLSNSSLSQAIDNLHQLHEKMREEGGRDTSTDWITDLLANIPSWFASLLRYFLPAIATVIIALLLACCCIAVCKKLTTKAATSMLYVESSEERLMPENHEGGEQHEMPALSPANVTTYYNGPRLARVEQNGLSPQASEERDGYTNMQGWEGGHEYANVRKAYDDRVFFLDHSQGYAIPRPTVDRGHTCPPTIRI